jgi:hypothetical protein
VLCLSDKFSVCIVSVACVLVVCCDMCVYMSFDMRGVPVGNVICDIRLGSMVFMCKCVMVC